MADNNDQIRGGTIDRTFPSARSVSFCRRVANRLNDANAVHLIKTQLESQSRSILESGVSVRRSPRLSAEPAAGLRRPGRRLFAAAAVYQSGAFAASSIADIILGQSDKLNLC